MPRRGVRTALACLALLGTTVWAPTVSAEALAQSPDTPVVSVQKIDDAYFVTATFSVPFSAADVHRVLTDYPNIPRFMPDVVTSQVVERQGRHVLVEQEAVSTYLFFSKRVHLMLDIEEAANRIEFRDRDRTSFERYEGAWSLAESGEVTTIGYELTAQPAFRVPGFVFRKLLDRDARTLVDQFTHGGPRPGWAMNFRPLARRADDATRRASTASSGGSGSCHRRLQEDLELRKRHDEAGAPLQDEGHLPTDLVAEIPGQDQ